MKLVDLFLTTSIIVSLPQFVCAAEPIWKDKTQSPAIRAKALVNAMTQDEKLQLIVSQYGAPHGPKNFPMPMGALGSAAYVPGIKRLGIPAQQITDAGLGVADPSHISPATALPSGQSMAGTFDPDLAYKGGVMIAKEAFHRGFNVLLGGAFVLVRDPRNGRNFEYFSEDPLLTGNMAAAQIQGIQSQHVISTIKHYAFNSIETNRMNVNMKIGEQAGRESDLLAFEIAVKIGQPGAIMCAYNKVNGTPSCENSYLLQLPKREWGYHGYVMTDWGAGSSTVEAANAGLDQESAASQFDKKIYFGKPLQVAIKQGKVPQGRLDDMAYRIMFSLIQVGVYDDPAYKSDQPEDVAAHEAISQEVAENGSVLLQNNNNILPLSSHMQKIAIIGGYADKGVLSGGGSSQVTPRGGSAVLGLGPQKWPGPIVYNPSSPMKEIQNLVPHAQISFADGTNIQQAVDLAKSADVAIVFATKWSAESFDTPDLSLSDNQNKLIEAVAKSGKPVVVVLETGNPVDMPWLKDVNSVLAVWYPGSSGGKAIANILFGKVNPSGRLTSTWPKSLSQLPRPYIEGAGKIINSDPSLAKSDLSKTPVVSDVNLNIEGANVGYRWYENKKLSPLYPFGYGLSYTKFEYKKITLTKDFTEDRHTMQANVVVKNVGDRDGAEVIQVYGILPDGSPRRLVGFQKVFLKAGEKKNVAVTLFPAAFSHYRLQQHDWEIMPGTYQVIVASNALSNEKLRSTIQLEEIILHD